MTLIRKSSVSIINTGIKMDKDRLNDILEDADKWDNREYGADERYVKVAPVEEEEELDRAIGMKAISIRLPVKLIDSLKLIAEVEGVGYQPLIRDVLDRFAGHEVSRIASEIKKEQIERARNLLAA